jgi:hypothetical protein
VATKWPCGQAWFEGNHSPATDPLQGNGDPGSSAVETRPKWKDVCADTRVASFTGGLSDNLSSARKGRKEDKKKCTTPYRCVSYVYKAKPESPESTYILRYIVEQKIRLIMPYFFFSVSVSILCPFPVVMLEEYPFCCLVFLSPTTQISACPIVKIKASNPVQSPAKDQQLGLLDLQGESL